MNKINLVLLIILSVCISFGQNNDIVWKRGGNSFTDETKNISEIVNNVPFNCSASLSEDGKVVIWETSTGKTLVILKKEYFRIRRINFSNDGKYLISTTYHESEDTNSNEWNNSIIDSLIITFWDSKSGKRVRDYRFSRKDVWSVGITPDLNELYLENGGQIERWNLSNKKLSKTIKFNFYDCQGTYSPNINYLVLEDDPVGNITVCDLINENQIFRTQAHKGFVRTVSWSRDEKLLITSGQDDNSLKVWEIPSGKLLKTLKLDVPDVHYGSVSPSGKYFAGSGKNGIVAIWELESGNKIRSYSENLSYIWSITWSPDEGLVLSGNSDGTIIAWQTKIPH